MLLDRVPCPAPCEAYAREGDLFVLVHDPNVTGIAFRLMKPSVVFRDWLERAGPIAEEEVLRITPTRRVPWLEYPFREKPSANPHLNHGNMSDDPEHYLVVAYLPSSELLAPRRTIVGLFVPAETCRARLLEHFHKVFGEKSRIEGVRLPEAVPLPLAA